MWTSSTGGAAGSRPAVAPLAHRRDDVPQIAALLRQQIVVPQRPLPIRDALEHARVDKPLQALRQHVAGDAEARLELVEARVAEEHVAEDQQRPPLAHDLEALGDRAVHVGEALALHPSTIAGCITQLNGLWFRFHDATD